MNLLRLKIKKEYIFLILFNGLYVLGFTLCYILTLNYEFLMNSVTIIFLLLIICLTSNLTKFSNYILWLLSFAGFLHMAGGGIIIKGKVLYSLDFFHIVGSGDSFILRFDQISHFYGMFIMTIIAYHLLNIYLVKDKKSFFTYIATFFIGIGWGALVEIGELFMVVFVTETGVGGYFNNAIDLVFNALGAICAVIFLYIKNKRAQRFL